MVAAQDLNDIDGQGYILNRNHLAACRLNLQHYLWKEAIGFLIEPSISLPDDASVADVACGDGIWLLDAYASRLLPKAQLKGFDVDLSQAPHSNWLPSNITFNEWNIFEDIHPRWEGQFDFVHVRLLVLVLSGEARKPFVERLYKLLKPGGYLQWDELDPHHMHVRKIDDSIASPAMDQLRDICYSSGRQDWTLQIPELLSEAGFADTKMTEFGDPTYLARTFNELHMLTIEEMASGVARTGKRELAVRMQTLIGDANSEAINGVVLCIPRIVVVARRPL
ncbi:S-adenosyl-L-methionine-dependent methyltransferase [Lophiostoma macrostomum CBS 122681]|uniref:S-adenosyl-L-methionine-dependent methyltransferase n=1 Tax=Lophiostoma macrostomum CBS 122681 TaxID=1314788 RepID=A0A6A6T8F1_9PLEO|nr:S-adenosyl-L-methionine-dependent methyltransferase [Lophiostoma macrostomum CBS 122681]